MYSCVRVRMDAFVIKKKTVNIVMYLYCRNSEQKFDAQCRSLQSE